VPLPSAQRLKISPTTSRFRKYLGQEPQGDHQIIAAFLLRQSVPLANPARHGPGSGAKTGPTIKPPVRMTLICGIGPAFPRDAVVVAQDRRRSLRLRRKIHGGDWLSKPASKAPVPALGVIRKEALRQRHAEVQPEG